MKKFLVKGLWFCILVVLIYPFAIFISVEYFPAWLRPNVQYFRNGDGYLLQRMQEADTTSNIDILFLGSSHTYQAYDPKHFPDYRIMNLGSSNQTYVQTNFLLKKYLEAFSPKIIVYELNPNMLNNDDSESTIDILSNSDFSKEQFQLMHRDNWIRFINTMLYVFIKNKISSEEHSTPLNDVYGDKYIGSGFVEKNKEHNTKFKEEEFIYIPPSMNAHSLEAFKESVHYIQQKRIPILFVYTPVTSRFYDFIGKEKKIEVIKEVIQGYPYYNFNTLSQWNDTLDFYDEHHLNKNGIEKYNQTVFPLIDSVIAIK